MAKRARPRVHRDTDWTDGHRKFLRTGFACFGKAVPGFFRGDPDIISVRNRDKLLDLEAVRRAWDDLRAAILADWIREQPGTRPRAWWWFDAPEPRRRMIAGPAVLHVDKEHAGRDWWYGVPSVWGGDDFRQDMIFETQAAYLDRHGLLTAEERVALGDFPTQEILFHCRKTEPS